MIGKYKLRLRQACRIESIVGLEDARVVEVRELACSYPYPMTRRMIERGNVGPDIQVLILYTAVPKGIELVSGWRVVYEDGVEYRISHVNGWPEVEPEYLELVLQRE